MKRQLVMPFGLLRPHWSLVARFAATSLGRAALTAASILLLREFLAGVLGEKHGLAEHFGVESAPWITGVEVPAK